jgi:FMN reductase
MLHVTLVAGSPSASSRVASVLSFVENRLHAFGVSTEWVHVRELPADDLLRGVQTSPLIKETHQRVARAEAVVIGTPIYKAAYSGLLKTWLDLMPERALRDKVVWPVATGGTIAHFLALDYSLRPVLAALGSSVVLSSVFVHERQVQTGPPIRLDEEAVQRLDGGVANLVRAVSRPWRADTGLAEEVQI